MSYADNIFKKMCHDILTNGTDTSGEKVRAHWEDDGSPAYTIKKFGVCNRYDLRKEFPALTLRKTYIKSAMDEILWIYQKKSNNIHMLNSKIWDQWADPSGSIGMAYGYQISKTFAHHKATKIDYISSEMKDYPSRQVIMHGDEPWIYLDQIDAVIWDLKHNPYSRRIMTNMYNHQDLYGMNLHPCAYSMTFNVTHPTDSEKPVLNMVLNQRSQDVLAANNWNVVQYSIMLMMIAQVCDMIPGELVHMITDAHIYNRHVDAIKELIGRKEYPAPKVWLDPEIKNFYEFTTKNLHIEDYTTGEQIKDIPIAV